MTNLELKAINQEEEKKEEEELQDFRKLEYWKKVEKYFNETKKEWDSATKYALDVYFKRILASKMVQYATARHLLFLYKWKFEQDFPFFYDEKRINKIEKFASGIKIDNKKFIFLDFRKFVAGFTFGWIYKDDKETHMTNEVFDVEARKQGKSSFWAMIMLAAARDLMSKKGAQIYISGPVKDSSKILYKLASSFITFSPKIKHKFKKVNTLQLVSTQESIIKALPFEDNVLEGQNPSLVILTEYHMHPDDRMYLSAKRANSSFNRNILIVFDTTKGDAAYTVCFERERHYKNKLREQIYNPEKLGLVYNVFLFCAELDEEDIPHWENEKLWPKANPLLNDKTLGPPLLHVLRAEYNELNNENAKRSFAAKRLGIWAGGAETYFNHFEVYESNKQSKKYLKKQIKNNFEGYNAIMGVDLSSHLDLTCITLLFQIPLDNQSETKENILWAFKSWNFIPEETVAEHEKTDKVPYRDWAKKGWLQITPGKVIDYKIIAQKIIDLKAQYNVIMLGYDDWNFAMVKDMLLKSGKFFENEMEPIKQGIHLTQSFKIFDSALKKENICFLDNEITMNHILNISAKEVGANKNLRITKSSNYDRIDNMMAMLSATALLFKVHPTRYKIDAQVINVDLDTY